MSLAHAKLSASGSHRWINCPGSVRMEQNYKDDRGSVFAQEGTRAHTLAEMCFRQEADTDKFIGMTVDGEVIEKYMADYVQEYVDYVRSFEKPDTKLYTERRVRFWPYIKEGFGTADNIIVDDENGIIHVFDLKYGKGIPVSPENNTQGMLYALGAVLELDPFEQIDHIIIHIGQPRLYAFEAWSMTRTQLFNFASEVRVIADMTAKPEAPLNPGEKQCQWCKAKHECQALFDHTANVINAEFEDLTVEDAGKLSDERMRYILDNKNLIDSFMSAIEIEVKRRLEDGKDFDGWKLVEGRSVRKFLPEAEDRLNNLLGEDAYTKKLLGITAAQKLVGKEVMDEITHKPQGAPALAPEGDKRKLYRDNIVDLFE